MEPKYENIENLFTCELFILFNIDLGFETFYVILFSRSFYYYFFYSRRQLGQLSQELILIFLLLTSLIKRELKR